MQCRNLDCKPRMREYLNTFAGTMDYAMTDNYATETPKVFSSKVIKD